MKKQFTALALGGVLALGVAVGAIATIKIKEAKFNELRGEKSTITDTDVIITDKSSSKASQEQLPMTSQADSLITEKQAKEFALKKAGVSENDISQYKSELDKDGGIFRYEIEFHAGGYEYDIEVSAKDGKIISFDKEKDSIFD